MRNHGIHPAVFKMTAIASRAYAASKGYEVRIDWDEQAVEILGTNFCLAWSPTRERTFDCEVLTNYTRDGKYWPMKNSFTGSHNDCIDKAIGIHEYYQAKNKHQRQA